MIIVSLITIWLEPVSVGTNEANLSTVNFCDTILPPGYDPLTSDSGIPLDTTVELNYLIYNIDDISVTENSLTMRIDIQTSWCDKRLIGNKKLLPHVVRPMNKKYHPCFWTPTFYTFQLKSIQVLDDEMEEPKLVVIDLDHGRVLLIKTYRFVVSCNMHLAMYPMDRQVCRIAFYTITTTLFHLKFAQHQFLDTPRLTFGEMIYELVSITKVDCLNDLSYATSCIGIEFRFERRLPLYLMTVYFPSSLIVIVSFTSFWIRPDAVPGRVTLSVTSLLALMTQLVAVRKSVPEVSYVTAVDIWFLACITFVTCSMFEFAISYSFMATIADRVIMYQDISPHDSKLSVLRLIRRKIRSLSVDTVSKVLFPLTFLGYTLVYWITLTYLAHHQNDQYDTIHHDPVDFDQESTTIKSDLGASTTGADLEDY